MNKYVLEVDEEQLKYIAKTLDFFARIQTGQLSELSNPYMVTLPEADYNDVDLLLQTLKKIMYPNLPETAFYSLKSKAISDDIRQIVDIYEIIRFCIDTKEDKRKPIQWSSEREPPKISKITDEPKGIL